MRPEACAELATYLANLWAALSSAAGSQRHQVSLLDAIEKLYKISYKRGDIRFPIEPYIEYNADLLFAINEMVNRRPSPKMP